MTTTLDIVDQLFTKLDASALKTAITGSICKHKRDGNSSLEDVVINCLPVNNEQLQNAIANVNIHVPDLVINTGGMEDKQPNHVRLKTLSAMAVDILKDNWTATLNYDVQQQVIIQDRDAGDYYINIRIEFFIENL